MFFLSGVAKYLVRPARRSGCLRDARFLRSLANAGSHSRDVSAAGQGSTYRPSRNPLVLFQRAFERGFERVRTSYQAILTTLVYRRKIFVPLFLVALYRRVAADSGPGSGLLSRAPIPASSNCTCARKPARALKKPPACAIAWMPPSAAKFLTPSSTPFSTTSACPTARSISPTAIPATSAPATPTFWFRSSRSTGRRPTTCASCANDLPREFPGTTFYLLPADIVTQILNFGLPAPIDIQIDRQRRRGEPALRQPHSAAVAAHSRRGRSPCPSGLRRAEAPHLNVDRTKAAQSGFTPDRLGPQFLTSLSGSFQTQPTFWLNPENGVSYNLVTQTPQYRIQSLQDLHNMPDQRGPSQKQPEILSDVADISRTTRARRRDPLQHPPHRRYFTVPCRAAIWGRSAASINKVVERQPQIPAARLRAVRCAGRSRRCALPLSACWRVCLARSCWSIC